MYYDADNNPATPPVQVNMTMTDTDGNYYFGMLPPGNYTVAIPTAPAGTNGSSAGQDGDTGTDGNDKRRAGCFGHPVDDHRPATEHGDGE